MKYTVKRLRFLVTLLCILLLGGCGKRNETSIEEQHYTPQALFKTAIEIESASDMDIYAESLRFLDDVVYYTCENKTGVSAENSPREIYRAMAANGAYSEKITSCLDPYFLNYDVVKSQEGNYIYTLSSDGKSFIVRKYLENGEEIDALVLDWQPDRDQYPTNIIVNGKDGFFLWGNNAAFIVDTAGQKRKTVACSEGSFQRGTIYGDNKALFSCIDADSNAYLAVLDGASGNLNVIMKQAKVELTAFEDEIYQYDGTYFCAIDMNQRNSIPILNFTDYGIVSQWIRNISVDEKGYHIICFDDTGREKIQIIHLNEVEGIITEAEMPSGKQEISIWASSRDLLRLGVTDDMIATFNMLSDKYKVVIYDNTSTIDTMLASEHAPDILYGLLPDNLEDYIRNGYVEDLWPFIDRSIQITRNDIHPSIAAAFEQNGSLYAIPRSICIQSLLGRKSCMPEEEKWSVNEFLTWLKNNPTARSDMGLTAQSILMYCVQGNLNEYVDIEKGEASFTDDFAKTLLRIKEIEIDDTTLFFPTWLENSLNYKEIPYLMDSYLNDMNQLGRLQYLFGDRLINMGLPNDAGEKTMRMIAYNNLSICSKSTCKEGAYAFIEFCLLYGPEKIASAKSNGSLWTIRQVYEDDINQCLGMRSIYLTVGAVTEEIQYSLDDTDKALITELMAGVTVETKASRDILQIIQEETDPFWIGQMSADVVTSNIQNRVQNYLDER
ncbi:MAG: ABC transporter substrate-binding protein [Acetatifactor sp.]|nr:ABC transporter substrate-binding protein [Acetatifactor sp.]